MIPRSASARATPASPWIAYRSEKPRARCRLLCFPFAGGSASAFRTWGAELPAEIEVWPVQPPGREGRIHEEPFSRVEDLVAALARGLAPELARGTPFAFFGHSLGTLVAYELARSLRREGLPGPRHLFVSAHIAPQQPSRDEPIHSLPEPEFRDRLRRLNGTPEEVLAHPELMELLGPLLRADFAANETYAHRDGPPLDCPITAFGGLTDEDVGEEDLRRWSERTHGPFRLRLYSGDHFYLAHRSGEAMRRDLVLDLFDTLRI